MSELESDKGLCDFIARENFDVRYLSRHVEHLNKEGWVIQICLQVSVCSPLLPFVLLLLSPLSFL